MAALARLFDWKNALVVVKPDTLRPGLRRRLFHAQYRSEPRPVPKLGPFEIAHKISSLDALGIRAKSRVFRAAGLTSDTHELADE